MTLRRIVLQCLIATALLFTATSVWAHHSTTAVFEMQERVSWQGTLTKVDWVNPHVQFYMDVTGGDGKVVPWQFETNPPAWFRRVKVQRKDFVDAIGGTLTVEGAPPKDKAQNYGYVLKITFPDGHSMEFVRPDR